MYKNGPPSSLMRASCTDYYELITDNFITSGISTYFVIIVQPPEPRIPNPEIPEMSRAVHVPNRAKAI